MSFLVKQMLGDKLKNMTGGAEEAPGAGVETPASKGMSKEEFAELQKQQMEEQ